MTSITAETQAKPGLLNALKRLLYRDKDLWDFTLDDPKILAYYLSAFEQIKDPSIYEISPELIKSIKTISREYMGMEQKDEMSFSEPMKLYDIFKGLNLPSDIVDRLIQEQLKPSLIDSKVVKTVVKGLLDFLTYQNKRGVLVKLFWS